MLYSPIINPFIFELPEVLTHLDLDFESDSSYYPAPIDPETADLLLDVQADAAFDFTVSATEFANLLLDVEADAAFVPIVPGIDADTYDVLVLVAEHGSELVTLPLVNIPPALAALESSPLTFVYGTGQINMTSSILATDNNTVNLTYAKIRIYSGYFESEDLLSIDIGSLLGSATDSWNSTTGTLTISGAATVAQYQSMLRAIKYSNLSLVPHDTNRLVSFVINDGTSSSNTMSRQLNVQVQPDVLLLDSAFDEAIPDAIDATPDSVTTLSTYLDFDASIQDPWLPLPPDRETTIELDGVIDDSNP